MARLLIVLGAADSPRSESCLRREWLPSMQDGLALAGHPTMSIDAELLDLDAMPLPEDAVPDGAWQERILHAWLQSVAFDGERPESIAPAATLMALGRSRYFPGIPPEQLQRTLGRLHRYVTDGRHEIAAVAGAMTPETTLVIAHSLASVPALHALATRDSTRLLTMSSPFGLDPRTDKGIGAHWWNLRHRADALCSPVTPESTQCPSFHDVYVECDPRLRAPREYLATAEFGNALAAALS